MCAFFVQKQIEQLSLVAFQLCNFGAKISAKKNTQKVLMKLTPG